VIPITEKRVTKQDNQFEEFLSIVTAPPVIQYDTISTTNSIYKNAIAAACNANLPRTITPKAQELDIYSSITEGMHHRYFRENQLSHTDMNNLQSFHQLISHEDPRVCVPADVQHTPNHFVKIEEDKHFPNSHRTTTLKGCNSTHSTLSKKRSRVCLVIHAKLTSSVLSQRPTIRLIM
jgi:hypothetical protein